MPHKPIGVLCKSQQIYWGRASNESVLEFKKCVLAASLTKVCQGSCMVFVGGRNGSHMDKELGMEDRHMLLILIIEGDGDLCLRICCRSTPRNN